MSQYNCRSRCHTVAHRSVAFLGRLGIPDGDDTCLRGREEVVEICDLLLESAVCHTPSSGGKR